jgi:hypothetical protein
VPLVTFNRTIGAGLGLPLTARSVAEIADHMRAHSAEVAQLQIAPMAAPDGFAAIVESGGFRPVATKWAKMGRAVAEVRIDPTQLAIETLDISQADAFAATVLSGFGMPAVLKPWLAALVGREGWRCYGALKDGELVACAALYLAAADAWLGIAGTLPASRRLGAQGALMAARIADAARLGKRLAFTETAILDGDNPSLRNMGRAGFELMHERSNWVLASS